MVQWCPNQSSGGTEKTAMSGTATRSAQPKGEPPVPGNQDFNELLVLCMRTSPLYIRRSDRLRTVFYGPLAYSMLRGGPNGPAITAAAAICAKHSQWNRS